MSSQLGTLIRWKLRRLLVVSFWLYWKRSARNQVNIDVTNSYYCRQQFQSRQRHQSVACGHQTGRFDRGNPVQRRLSGQTARPATKGIDLHAAGTLGREKGKPWIDRYVWSNVDRLFCLWTATGCYSDERWHESVGWGSPQRRSKEEDSQEEGIHIDGSTRRRCGADQRVRQVQIEVKVSIGPTFQGASNHLIPFNFHVTLTSKKTTTEKWII